MYIGFVRGAGEISNPLAASLTVAAMSIHKSRPLALLVVYLLNLYRFNVVAKFGEWAVGDFLQSLRGTGT